MADVSLPTPTAVPLPAAIPLRQIMPWAVFGAVLAAVLLYFVGVEQGVLSVFSGETVHEFVHDGRHLLGFPCH
ncbi:CbtB domain-containing protein [Micromonospora sp. NPDC048999]|uniref:CbtB domain-containing protein n=1 Tax=Micromonospora sp. NPDC048999 TaxID=3155391 RepID=UPI0034056607